MLAALAVTAGGATPAASAAASGRGVPRFSHVIMVFLENNSANTTFEAGASTAPYFDQLRRSYSYIPNYFGVGHASLDNYVAVFSGQTPTVITGKDCQGVPWGQCVYPANVPTIATALDSAHDSWKVYSEGTNGAALGGPCLHVRSRYSPDTYNGVGTANGYVQHHNPVVYFDSILLKGASETYCRSHNVDLSQLRSDLQHPNTFPNFSFIEPDFCHDGGALAQVEQAANEPGAVRDPGCLSLPEGPFVSRGSSGARRIPRILHPRGHERASVGLAQRDHRHLR